MVSISVNITGTICANIVYMHYLRNATFQLKVSESSNVIAFLSKFTDVLNSSPSVENGPYISVIFSVSSIVQGLVHSLTSSQGSSVRWVILTPCYKGELCNTEGFIPRVWGSNPGVTDPKADWSLDLFALISFLPVENLFLINNLRQEAFLLHSNYLACSFIKINHVCIYFK